MILDLPDEMYYEINKFLTLESFVNLFNTSKQARSKSTDYLNLMKDTNKFITYHKNWSKLQADSSSKEIYVAVWYVKYILLRDKSDKSDKSEKSEYIMNDNFVPYSIDLSDYIPI